MYYVVDHIYVFRRVYINYKRIIRLVSHEMKYLKKRFFSHNIRIA